MAYYKFVRAAFAGEPIEVYGHGRMKRDFTYVDDIAQGVVRVLDRPAEANAGYRPLEPDPATSDAPFRVFNIGNHKPVPLLEYIGCIEDALGLKAQMNLLPLQDGDVPATYAAVDALRDWTGFTPATDIRTGVGRFVDWYRAYYRL